MAKKITNWKTRGMNRDLSVSAFNPEFAFENVNLRLGTNEGNTLMSWVNEKGTASLPIVIGNWVDGDDSTRTTITSILGTPIGTAVINHQLVLFTTDAVNTRDYIYLLKYSSNEKTAMLCKMLYGGDTLSLGFKADHPLKTMVSYESESIQKVYWTDGINQPRVINIAGNIRTDNFSVTQFDFVPTLSLQEEVIVEKQLGVSGTFAPGVLQYAFTYYRKNGQESCIFYTTPLLYVSFKDRGASPEEKVDNAFKITVKYLQANDFDYLRIYSIQRTSINATPIVKRVQDIDMRKLGLFYDQDIQKWYYKASYLDTGTSGNSITPTDLFYKGGEDITAETIEQKDNTLFLGDIHLKRPNIEKGDLKTAIQNNLKQNLTQEYRTVTIPKGTTGDYAYANQLSAVSTNGSTVPCAGFKYGDYYRLGIQFQYKTGKWSDPIRIDDVTIDNKPSLTLQTSGDFLLKLPAIQGTLSSDNVNKLLQKGYRKARAVVVLPNIQDRVTVCQGVLCPTVNTSANRADKNLYAQSSWFFRALPESGAPAVSNGSVTPTSDGELIYTDKSVDAGSAYNPNDSTKNIRSVEIQGDFKEENKFRVDWDFLTMHSPDIDFDTQLASFDYINVTMHLAGKSVFANTFSDIDIQTETPTVSDSGSGFVHKSFANINMYGIVAGLFYDDYCVDDYSSEAKPQAFRSYDGQKTSLKWMVYPWHKNGSLNNDINRPEGAGNGTSILKKKIISNLRIAKDTEWFSIGDDILKEKPQLFSSEEVSILKFGDHIYQGNIDTQIAPDYKEGLYAACGSSGDLDPTKTDNQNEETPFTAPIKLKLFARYNGDATSDYGTWRYGYQDGETKWKKIEGNIGNDYSELVLKRQAVRMKYKSTAHLALESDIRENGWEVPTASNALPVVEIHNPNNESRFGGTSEDALQENTWIPCGTPVKLVENTPLEYHYEYGDTYYQRWDCLKTYPFTNEDVNQIVEIGSFVLETRVNIDGRYDRNRGQKSNLYMTPRNFNLVNPVYSQVDNFFSYKIQSEDYYKDKEYYNQITWTLTKESGADVDAWTNITLANTLELDGDRGKVTSLNRLNNQLICFQESGISKILYNENFMVSTQEGVPIEIGNSGKVDGKSYISNTVGCSDQWNIVTGAKGLYFMDYNQKSIYVLGAGLENVSSALGFNAWCKQSLPVNTSKWNPSFPVVNGRSSFTSFYDSMNEEILFVNKDTALAFSEKYGAFTSFYDYGDTAFFCNLDDTGIWVKGNTLWKHQAGNYCQFFGTNKPYSMTLIGNPEPQTDKIFSNLEFRACVDGEGTVSNDDFTPYLPFNYLETWNEYQHGITTLSNRSGHSAFIHHSGSDSSLKRKFRIWRCDIPRDNAALALDEGKNITRFKVRPLDRMRNPWLYLKLMKNANSSNVRAEVHDLMVSYFN